MARGTARAPRLDDIGRALNLTLWPLVWLVVLTTVGGCVAAGLLVANGAGKPAALVALLGPSLAGVAGALVAFVGTRQHSALEAVIDHQVLEGRAWWRATRTRMPRTSRAAARWLASNGETPANLLRRADLLLWTGAVDDARSAIERFVPESPEERLDVEILRGNLAYLEGRPIDLERPRSTLRSVIDRVAWRQRRMCLALLEAGAALQDRTDPWIPLALARAELPAIDRRARGPRLIATGLTVVGLGVAIATLVVLLL